MRERGFTLMEMVVVLAVLALVLALVPPLLGGSRARAELEASARAIVAGLRETRALAMTQGRAQVFALDLAKGLYRGAGEKGTQSLPPGVQSALVTAAGERIGAAAAGIRFFPDGSSTGGRVTLARDGRRIEIAIDWLTGRIALQE
ncbi:MAG TPA: GspH/FimT family pseudopilin [Stellaceae bacterium]|nr:GspH/FimT family pseudopilin [Stellaceae bacterium]